MTRRLGRKLVMLVAAVLLALALPAAASAKLDDAGDWVPGSMLVRFSTKKTERILPFLASLYPNVSHQEPTIVRRLPLIPGGFELEVHGNLQDAVAKVYEHSGAHGVSVLWAQPNYYFYLRYFTSTKDKAYWPNDPYFWPAKSTNPNRCQGNQTALQQVGLWPTDADLRSFGDWTVADANPLPADQRLPNTGADTFGLAGTAQSSVNVLPVWNALSGSLPNGNRTTGPTGPLVDGARTWQPSDLSRSGIAVLDSGVSNAPDVARQVFGVISLGVQRTKNPTDQFAIDRATYVYSNSGKVSHGQLDELSNVLPGVDLQVAGPRELLPLDDLGSYPYNTPDDLHHPDGCDGHGTEVASVAAATTNNGQGTAGVGWNVPVLGIRPGVPVLDTALPPDLIHNPGQIIQQSKLAREVEFSDSSMIDALGVVKALHVPVLNMSWGSKLFTTGIEPHPQDLIVKSPAVVDAMRELLSDGVTLGVAAAGNGKYGVGESARGASTAKNAQDAIQFPCALPELGALKPKVLAGARGPQPFDVDVNWRRLNLLCVTATQADQVSLLQTTFPPNEADEPPLVKTAGSGESAIALAAPGVSAVATRPLGASVPRAAYRMVAGTSISAAMVSGAAALLREIVPSASAQLIGTALRQGAYSDVRIRPYVRYGQLDVACSALWLADYAARTGLFTEVTPSELKGPYTKSCFSPGGFVGELTWTLPKSEFDRNSVTDAGDGVSLAGHRRRGLASGLPRSVIGKDAAELALGKQGRALQPYRPDWPSDVPAFFPIRSGNVLARPQRAPDGHVYYFGGQRASCPAGSGLIYVGARWKSAIHPDGYLMLSQQSDIRGGTFLVVLVKPWYEDFLPAQMRIAVKLLCASLPPGVTG